MAEVALIGLAAASATTGVVNAVNESNARNDAAQMNKEIGLQQATLALQESVEDERRIRIQNRQVLGDIRSAYGASGVTLEGSAMDVLRDSAANAELDALTVRHQGEVKAWAYRNQARMDEFEGKASSNLLAGRILGNVFSAGSTVATTYALRRT